MVDVVAQETDVPGILNACMVRDVLKDIVLDLLIVLMIWIVTLMNDASTIFVHGLDVKMIQIVSQIKNVSQENV